ncbi:MAG: nucleotidyltransferase domain-containing protein [Fervidicoccaceae archaeon]|jgi:predicted nucleotidyltransferase
MSLELEERDKFRFFRLSKEEKGRIQEILRSLLLSHAEIVLAILYGSFLKEVPFRDIDIAVYVVDGKLDTIDYELNLIAEFEGKLGYKLDLKVLNDAPPWFVRMVLENGEVLFERIPLLSEKLYLKSIDEQFLIRRYSMDPYLSGNQEK